MDSVESKVLELTEAVCRLHFYDNINASAAIDKLKEQGFPNISIEFVQAIYERLIEGIKKR
jgi:hypothetical protein